MKKVIIVEDIKALIEKEKSFFNRTGFKIYVASANAEALALHKAEKADLIISKLDMPDMSGEMLCSLIRDNEELRNVSIIIVCSRTDADLERCLQCRANTYISSPVNIESLLQEAQKLLHIAPRLSFRSPISIKLKGEKKEEPFTGSTDNISTSGMLFLSDAILFEGDIIQCSFSLPDSKHISAIAEIVRVEEKETGNYTNHYGIKFTKISTDALSIIEKFIEKTYKHT